MAALNKDIQITIEFLAFLKAGLYGQVAFDNALGALKSSLLPEGYVDNAHRGFDKLEGWLADVKNVIPIFAASWDAPETFDSISAINFMRDLKGDLQWLMPLAEKALATERLVDDREAAAVLVASLMRTASARYAYVETLYETLSHLKVFDVAQQVLFEVDSAKEYLSRSQLFLRVFSQSESWSEELCEALRSEASLVANDFRSQIHDTNLLLNVFAKEITFDLVGFSVAEMEPWISAGVPPTVAGYWRAYDFSPEEFLEWSQLGVSGAPLAAGWRKFRFVPEQAVKWMREGFSPRLATPWFAAGFEPPRAASMIKRGVKDPAKAPKDSNGDE